MTKAGVRAVELLGPNAILAIADLADVLPRHSLARKIDWLRQHGLVHDFDGVEVVIYGDVLTALRGQRLALPTISRPTAPDPWDTLPRAKVGKVQ